jgi:hypothetical protein
VYIKLENWDGRVILQESKVKGFQKSFFIGNFIIKTSGETKNKKGGRRPEGHITDTRNTRKEEMSRRQRRMDVSLGGQGPEGAVAPAWNWSESVGCLIYAFL